MTFARSLFLLAAGGFAVALASCCCTSESVAAPLRPMPQFQPIPAVEAVEQEVIYAK